MFLLDVIKPTSCSLLGSACCGDKTTRGTQLPQKGAVEPVTCEGGCGSGQPGSQQQ